MQNAEHDIEAAREDEPVGLGSQGYLPVKVAWTILHNVRFVACIAGLASIFGAFIAFWPASKYTSTSKVIRGLQADGPVSHFGGLSLLRGFGVNLGMNTVGLGAESYPDILKSRTVCLAVVRDTFYFRELGKRITYVEYVNRKRASERWLRYTLRLPATIVSVFTSDRAPPVSRIGFPSREEMIAIEYVQTLVQSSVDPISGFMDISIVTEDPELSADLNASFLEKLVQRVEELRLYKSRRNLEFIEKQFIKSQTELAEVENALASFNDSNVLVRTSGLKTKRERLQRQVKFKEDLYNDLRVQLTQAKIDMSRSMSLPIITILDNPSVPIIASGPPRESTFIISIILGLLLSVLCINIRVSISRVMQDHRMQQQVGEIKAALLSVLSVFGYRRYSEGEQQCD